MSTLKSLAIVAICFLSMNMTLNAQQVVKLWNGNPPTSNGITTPEEIEGDKSRIGNVSDPDLTIYLPDKKKNTGLAVIICPGGGYMRLAFDHEGTEFAQWLNSQGIAGLILKYRMPNKHKEVPLDDAWQAMRYVRTHAKELGINPNRIGIAGFSAGGHLASTASTHFASEGISTRPDFSILFYPVITMGEATHQGSKKSLLGDKPSVADLNIYSNEKQVNNNTPPAILLLSDDDSSVVPQNSIDYYHALKQNNIKSTMYIFPEGGHGWGMRDSFKYHKQMLELLAMWLDDIKKD